MADDGRGILVVRGLGAASASVGALSLAPDADILFGLTLVLAQRAGERVGRSELRTLIWPAVPEESARHSLRQALYRLRKAGLGLDDGSDDVCLSPELVDSDLTRILAADWPERAEPKDIEAAAIVLPGFEPREQTALAEFVEALRVRVAAQYRRAVIRRIAAARREGRWRAVEHWALMCLQADPLNEEATLARAEAAAMVGAKNEALEILDAYLAELGDHARVIGLPARMLKRRVSELVDTSTRRIQATSAPFVGRHELLAAAQDALGAARGGASTALWFVGPAGIGKSRLLKEIERAARMAGWTTVRAGASPSFADRPLAVLTELLPTLLEAPGALGAAPHALTLMRQMGRADTGEAPLAPEEAHGRQHAVYHAWVELMDAVLAETALALVIDDMQWSDAITVLMLARYLESRPQARVAVILGTRRLPTRTDAAAARLLNASQARVGPLTDEEIRDFTLAAGLGEDAAFEAVTRRLGQASGGNPLFLSHLVHQHQLHGGPQELPTDLASLIDIQLRSLSRGATHLLQACALLGRHAMLPRIERALGVEARALVSAFGELDDMLALPSDPGEPLMPHDAWTERVRRGMSGGVFRSLAVSVARVLEADAAADGGIELYWDAARLFRESGEKQLAYATMMRCAEYLTRTGATAEASRAYLRASEYAVTERAREVALLQRIYALHSMTEWRELLRTLKQLHGTDSASQTHKPIDNIDLIELEAKWHYAGPVSFFDDLLKIGQNATEAPERRLHAIYIGLVASDNLFEAESVRRFIAVGKEVPVSADDAVTRMKMDIIAETAVGDLDRARTLALQYLELVRRSANAAALVSALRTASYPFRRSGHHDLAHELLEESAVLATKHHFEYARFRAYDLLAGLALDYEKYDDASRALSTAESLFSPALGGLNLESMNTSWTFCCIGLGDWNEARRRSSRIGPLDLARRSRSVILPAAAKLRVYLNDGDDEEASAILDHLITHGTGLFAHSGVDQLATAVALGLGRFHSARAARMFASRFLKRLRRDGVAPHRALLALVD